MLGLVRLCSKWFGIRVRPRVGASQTEWNAKQGEPCRSASRDALPTQTVQAMLQVGEMRPGQVTRSPKPPRPAPFRRRGLRRCLGQMLARRTQNLVRAARGSVSLSCGGRFPDGSGLSSLARRGTGFAKHAANVVLSGGSHLRGTNPNCGASWDDAMPESMTPPATAAKRTARSPE